MGRSDEFSGGASGQPAMHHASMQTSHFHFEGFGATPEEAKAVVLKGFRAHMKQSGVSMKDWQADTGQAGSTDAHIEDWFGINTKPVHMNTAYRDDSPFHGPGAPKR